jgi:hypothetical protein
MGILAGLGNSKQLLKVVWGLPFFVSKIRDQKFGHGRVSLARSRVSRFHSCDFKSFEDLAGLGVVVVDPGFLLPG